MIDILRLNELIQNLLSGVLILSISILLEQVNVIIDVLLRGVSFSNTMQITVDMVANVIFLNQLIFSVLMFVKIILHMYVYLLLFESN